MIQHKSRDRQVDKLKAEIEELKDERQFYLDMKTESAFEQADEITISIWERENKLNKAGHVTLTHS